jgi:hypothetical protein
MQVKAAGFDPFACPIHGVNVKRLIRWNKEDDKYAGDYFGCPECFKQGEEPRYYISGSLTHVTNVGQLDKPILRKDFLII